MVKGWVAIVPILSYHSHMCVFVYMHMYSQYSSVQACLFHNFIVHKILQCPAGYNCMTPWVGDEGFLHAYCGDLLWSVQKLFLVECCSMDLT